MPANEALPTASTMAIAGVTAPARAAATIASSASPQQPAMTINICREVGLRMSCTLRKGDLRVQRSV